MFGNFQPKNVVRKVTVTTPAKPKPKQDIKASSAPAATPPSRTSTPQSGLRNTSISARPKASTPQPRKHDSLHPTNGHVRQKTLIKQAVKRKASTPPPQWDDSDDDDADSGDDSDLSFDSARKRIRSSASSVDPGRILADRSNRSKEDKGQFALAHGADLVSGDNAAKFRPAFLEEVATAIELQYPSNSLKERFFLADSVESDGYKSMEDIVETVKYVCENYLPAREAELHSDPDSGFERRLTRAIKAGSSEDFVRIISEFNTLIRSRVDDGTIQKTLESKHALNFNWTKRILDQVYARTVSPHVEILREYKNGTDNVYGELLYPLVSEMFRETGLRSDHVFVDLGSGVGNVVLQAALEIGCESWGCEMMRNPCDLADLQAEEFPVRARLWGLAVGEVHLLRGDFLANEEIGRVLRRADVVLVNNQAFGPDLNSRLIDRFLDLKDGAQIVSLKTFKPDGLELQERNANDPRHLLRVRKREYFSNRVSWTDAPGNYYIATKDPGELIRFQNGLAKRRR